MERTRKLADTAMFAGELMLRAGADIYRVEDTMSRILDRETTWSHEVVALPTAIYLTLVTENEKGKEKDALSLVKRIDSTSINLNTIYAVNHISRKLCLGQIDVDEAYERMVKLTKKPLYPEYFEYICYVFVSTGFLIMFDGNINEFILTAIAGTVLSLVKYTTKKWGFNDICINAATSFMIVVTALLGAKYLFKNVSVDLVIISPLMCLVPGVKCTTAIKDTLNGDYNSGGTRMLEAIIISLAVATGTGAAMALMGGILR